MEKNAASRNEKLFIVPEYGRRVYTGIVPLAPRPPFDGEDLLFKGLPFHEKEEKAAVVFEASSGN